MPKPRGKKRKSLLPVLHIFCEGAKTEPNYINGYIDTFHPGVRRLNVVQVEASKKNTPVELVADAKAKKNDPSVPESDHFWVVYDRESEAKYPNELHQKAFQTAASAGIHVALSSVCFEFWLLLHFCNSSACFSCYDNLIQQSDLKDYLKKEGGEKYEKGYAGLFSIVSDRVGDARRRASSVNKSVREASENPDSPPYLLNPYTDVHLLLDAIDDFVEGSLKEKNNSRHMRKAKRERFLDTCCSAISIR